MENVKITESLKTIGVSTMLVVWGCSEAFNLMKIYEQSENNEET